MTASNKIVAVNGSPNAGFGNTSQILALPQVCFASPSLGYEARSNITPDNFSLESSRRSYPDGSSRPPGPGRQNRSALHYVRPGNLGLPLIQKLLQVYLMMIDGPDFQGRANKHDNNILLNKDYCQILGRVYQNYFSTAL